MLSIQHDTVFDAWVSSQARKGNSQVMIMEKKCKRQEVSDEPTEWVTNRMRGIHCQFSKWLGLMHM